MIAVNSLRVRAMGADTLRTTPGQAPDRLRTIADKSSSRNDQVDVSPCEFGDELIRVDRFFLWCRPA